MTRIRNLLIAFQMRRAAQQVTESDAVSFESFRNHEAEERQPAVKESSLTNVKKKPPPKREQYMRFIYGPRVYFKRPTLSAVILAFSLIGMFLVFPVMYLLHCFSFSYMTTPTQIQPQHTMKTEVQYTPDTNIHNYWNLYGDSRAKTILPPPPEPTPGECKIIADLDKFDCYPEDEATAEKCALRGCCWSPPKYKRIKTPLNIPYCFYPTNYSTYKFVNSSKTAYGLDVFLKRYYQSPYPNDAEFIKMQVKYETADSLNIKITDPLQRRFQPPYPPVRKIDEAAQNLSYHFIIDAKKTGFRILRKSDNVAIFDTSGLRNLIFSDQFLQISSRLPTKYIYGLGEHRNNLLLDTNWQRFTMFNGDRPPVENQNLYGSHPFYLGMEESGNAHGVFLLNSNAMDVILQPKPAITFRPIGGILNLYFFLGPSPADVIRQYTELVGRPFLPPYWGLGFHLCRYGYKSLNHTREIMERNIDAGILIDTQWNDLDYMNSSNDFTYDHDKFKGLPEFVKELHNRGMHYIPLIDPGVSASELSGTYPPYDKAIEMDILVKNLSGEPFVGKVWNRATTVWPDFTHPDTITYWNSLLQSMHDTFPFDGAWIDMNEPSNFLSGSFDGCPKSNLETPPYVPNVAGGQLNYKTLCMTAQHYVGMHYDVHNLYGFGEAIVTNLALATVRNKRPMVISRSTFSGHGHYAGHWSGDVASAWHDMRYSIPQLLSFSLFGIPLMGADICGFNGNTTIALCNRWSQLGAFYPFSRNHNTDDGIPQDPASLGKPVLDSAKKALEIRYSLLPYLYTLFYEASIQGDTVARPVFFEFSNDRNTYDIDYMFMWGSALLIVPVLEENKVSVDLYLPSVIWYDYYTKDKITTGSQTITLPAPEDTIPILIRGGSVIPQQKPNRTTVYSRKSPVELLCAPDERGYATGKLFWDDGDSLNTVDEEKYSLIEFDLAPNKLQISPSFWGLARLPNLDTVMVLGIDKRVEEVLMNNISQTFKYDTIHKYLLVEGLNSSFSDAIEFTWK